MRYGSLDWQKATRLSLSELVFLLFFLSFSSFSRIYRRRSSSEKMNRLIFAVSIAIFCVSVCAGAVPKFDSIDYELEQNEIPVDEIPFKIETDYAKPTRCQDLETGTFYKVGAEWYSSDPSLCLKMSCQKSYFPEVTVTKCSDYFKTNNPKTACNLRKRASFPHCCEECRGR